MRVTNDVLNEIIENDGCRRGSVVPINSTGVVRLALDLQEARAELARLKVLVAQARSCVQMADGNLSPAALGAPEDRANKTTGLGGGKRTKKK